MTVVVCGVMSHMPPCTGNSFIAKQDRLVEKLTNKFLKDLKNDDDDSWIHDHKLYRKNRYVLKHNYIDCLQYRCNRSRIRRVMTTIYLMCLKRVGLSNNNCWTVLSFVDLTYIDEICYGLCRHVDDSASRLTKLLVPSLKDWARCYNCHALVTPTFASKHCVGDVNACSKSDPRPYDSTMLCENCICSCLLDSHTTHEMCMGCFNDCCGDCACGCTCEDHYGMHVSCLRKEYQYPTRNKWKRIGSTDA